jgi:hypothetical protein
VLLIFRTIQAARLSRRQTAQAAAAPGTPAGPAAQVTPEVEAPQH